MPRLYVRRRLCSAFWWEKLPSHQIFRSLSVAKYSGVFRFFACSCRASSCSIRSTMRLFLELPTHCCRQGQLLHYLIESYIVHHTGKIRTSSPSGTGSDFSFLSKYYMLSLHPRFCLSQNRGLRMFEKTILFGRAYFSSACLTASGSPGPGLSFWS